jgi:hypothetical protein
MRVFVQFEHVPDDAVFVRVHITDGKDGIAAVSFGRVTVVSELWHASFEQLPTARVLALREVQSNFQQSHGS